MYEVHEKVSATTTTTTKKLLNTTLHKEENIHKKVSLKKLTTYIHLYTHNNEQGVKIRAFKQRGVLAHLLRTFFLYTDIFFNVSVASLQKKPKNSHGYCCRCYGRPLLPHNVADVVHTDTNKRTGVVFLRQLG